MKCIFGGIFASSVLINAAIDKCFERNYKSGLIRCLIEQMSLAQQQL